MCCVVLQCKSICISGDGWNSDLKAETENETRFLWDPNDDMTNGSQYFIEYRVKDTMNFTNASVRDI